MQFRYFFFRVLLVGFLSGYAVADTTQEVSETISTYWSHFKNSDFDGASEYISPTELSALKEHLLPVFLEAQKSNNPEVIAIANMFFDGIPPHKRSEMSQQEVFVGLMRFTSVGARELFSVLPQTSMKTVKVIPDGSDSALADCKMLIGNHAEGSIQRLERVGGKWYLKLDQSPADTAEKMRRILLR